MKHSFTSSLLLATAITLTGCDIEPEADRKISTVEYAGHHNTITGKLSDGTPFEGIAWFQRGATRGEFCLQAADFVCSGKFSASVSRRISGDFVCSNMTTGWYQTERIQKGNHLVPVAAHGALSDGRTSVATFAPLQKGTGQTTCYR